MAGSPLSLRAYPFIRANVTWRFHATREKTKQACTQVLGRLPADIRDHIIDSKSLLVFAPGAGQCGEVHPFALEVPKNELKPCFQVVIFPFELERYNPRQMVAFIVKCLAAALRHKCPPDSDMTPEKVAVLWGFGHELGRRGPAIRRDLN